MIKSFSLGLMRDWMIDNAYIELLEMVLDFRPACLFGLAGQNIVVHNLACWALSSVF